MPTLTRRGFLYSAAASTAFAGTLPRMLGKPRSDSPSFLLEVMDASPIALPSRFLGLSYEQDQLSKDGYFSIHNQSLVERFRALGPGILRLGGATAEWSFIRSRTERAGLPERLEQLSVWQPDSSNRASADRWAAQKVNYISPDVFPELRGFLDACDWNCIYGVNFGSGTPDDAVAAVSAVSSALRPRLEAIQICNEPDFLFAYCLRPPISKWWVNDFIREWERFYDAISTAHPSIKIGGPDALGETSFAREFLTRKSKSLNFASVHYYQSNDTDPVRSTISELLKRDPEVARRIASVRNLSGGTDLPVRLTETNSVSPGGKTGVSDTLAAGLWSIDFLFQLAMLGVIGLNFHSGGGPYTAIAGDLRLGFHERPLYKGMKLVSRAVGGRLLNTRTYPAQVDTNSFAVYAVACNDCRRVFLINKHPRASRMFVIRPGVRFSAIRTFSLSGPALESTDEVSLIERDDANFISFPRWSVRKGCNQVNIVASPATALLLEFLPSTSG